MDREKVIKGLECHRIDNNHRINCADCPYYVEGDNYMRCVNDLHDDALALLKEQEEKHKILLEQYDTAHNLISKLLKEQEAKTGKWIEKTDYVGDTYYDCSVCNESWMTIEGTPWVNGMNYCPHCGAKMEFEGR